MTLLPPLHFPLLTLNLTAHFTESEHGVIFDQAAVLLLYHQIGIRLIFFHIDLLIANAFECIASLPAASAALHQHTLELALSYRRVEHLLRQFMVVRGRVLLQAVVLNVLHMVIVVKMVRRLLLVHIFVVDGCAPKCFLRLLTREVATIVAVIVVQNQFLIVTIHGIWSNLILKTD